MYASCPPTRRLLFAALGVAILLISIPTRAAISREAIITSGLSSPIFVTAAPGDTTRLFVAELGGIIRIIQTAGPTLDSTPFLDIDSIVRSGGERGLLGLAFHPDYDQNGYFYVHYSAESPAGDTVIARYEVSAGDPDVANAGSANILYTTDQPFQNHNGGMIAFKPNDTDHYLYVALGDGGSFDDPDERAQDLELPLGKMLRLDVNVVSGLATVPSGNPYDDGAGDNEDFIWSYGLRNPWRFSFDRLTSDMYIGDVGQNAVEEVDFEPENDPGGANYGWDLLEGSEDFECTSCNADRANTVLPIHEYPNAGSGAVTGGYVYRGTDFPTLTGRYFFGDSSQLTVSSFVYSGTPSPSVTSHTSALNPTSGSMVSFGEGADGELYMVDVFGGIYRIIETVPFTPLLNVFADFEYTGPQFGTVSQPYYTLEAALEGVIAGGSITIEAGSTESTLSISTEVTLQASGGTVTIGASGGARSAKAIEGFISGESVAKP